MTWRVTLPRTSFPSTKTAPGRRSGSLPAEETSRGVRQVLPLRRFVSHGPSYQRRPRGNERAPPDRRAAPGNGPAPSSADDDFLVHQLHDYDDEDDEDRERDEKSQRVARPGGRRSVRTPACAGPARSSPGPSPSLGGRHAVVDQLLDDDLVLEERLDLAMSSTRLPAPSMPEAITPASATPGPTRARPSIRHHHRHHHEPSALRIIAIAHPPFT